ncbi:MAG: alpha/beta fold hydrolase, partial [Actinomycetia bacterium]|nr:alpha/beta fold hydrolase [Actinomycetes bacterium]
MTQQDLILVHGTWGHEDEWEDFAAELEARGYRVHAPSLPKHGPVDKIDIWSTAGEVAKLGLRDYVADLKARVEEMETEPIIVGHSLGGLI